MNVMLATVGGSSRPVVVPIERYQPAFVAFVCSEDSARQVNAKGKPCDRESLPCIASQAQLIEGSYRIELVEDPDDLEECYGSVRAQLRSLRQEFPGSNLLINYTGGTKTMAAAALMAAFDDSECQVIMVTGQRDRHSTGVIDGTENIVPLDIATLSTRRMLKTAMVYLDRYDYQGARTVLDQCGVRAVARELNKAIRQMSNAVKGFAAWDNLDYKGALDPLRAAETIIANGNQYIGALTRAKKSIEMLTGVGTAPQIPDGKRRPRIGFDPAYDLIHNAERRGEQGRYDDAVARLYRALECYAQIALADLPSPIQTASVKLDSLPERLRESYRPRCGDSGCFKADLKTSYALLTDLDHPVGNVFQKHRDRILQLLEMRNHSLMAHGFTPVSRSEYERAFAIIKNFVLEADTAQQTPMGFDQTAQFPRTLMVDLD